MSRAFVKEDDQEEAPFIPPRAPLPENETNYVTAAGKKALIQEKSQLEEEKTSVKFIEKEADRRRALATLNGKMKLLESRINSARVLTAEEQPQDEVRFGAKVQFTMNGKVQFFQIVGVDEANVKDQKIAFTAPIAKALMGKKVGAKPQLMLGKEGRSIEILAIDY
ncbi:transcription elongation factor GreB [Marivirga sericea]|uniref:Transcription elongation factor GreB n=1 Tax=Marivirga sericea TaxID=1028 RepID=A0A1X7IIK1_9BACT|nr:GreA/GreB family elongation factor [Marivirga sericea]SMG14417.1 transcription elongation factor GreB [Marivirga sericea]